MDTGEVHRLVDLALVGRALAEARLGHDVVAAHPRAHRDSDGVEHLRADRRRQRDDVVRGAAVVAGHLASAGADVVGLCQMGRDDVLGAHAEGQGAGDGPIERCHPVLAMAHRPRGRDLRALMALAADDECDLSGPLHQPHPLVHGAGEQHGPVHREHVVVAEAELGVPCVRISCHSPSLLYTWMAAPSTARAASARTSVRVG